MTSKIHHLLLQTFGSAGSGVVKSLHYAGSLGLLFVQSVGGCFMRPMRLRAVIYELWKIGNQSWFIITVSSLFIGMVLAFQSAYQMQKLAADIYIASLVSLSIIREIGPILSALIVAGRVGSSIAAELGTMKVTEQIDALITMAADPVHYLVVPRFIAMVIALPLLTLWANAVGILGGFLISTMKLGVQPGIYWRMTLWPIVFKDLGTGLLKAVVFAMIICTVSCLEGMRTGGGAAGVGRTTTKTVVYSFLFIIAADCIITALFYLS